MPYEGPGQYRHYKGGHYYALGLGIKEDTKGTPNEVVCVIYRPLTSGSILEEQKEDFWLRELEDFNASISIHGTLIPRFDLLSRDSS